MDLALEERRGFVCFQFTEEGFTVKTKRILIFALAWLLVPAIVLANGGGSYGKAIKVFRESPEVQRYFDNAYGYAVFPLVGKGGAGVGGAFGQGKVYKEGKVSGKVSWSSFLSGYRWAARPTVRLSFSRINGPTTSLPVAPLSLTLRSRRLPLLLEPMPKPAALAPRRVPVLAPAVIGSFKAIM